MCSNPISHMSYSLNSLKGGYIGDYMGDYYRGYYKGDTRSLDTGTYEFFPQSSIIWLPIAGLLLQYRSLNDLLMSGNCK